MAISRRRLLATAAAASLGARQARAEAGLRFDHAYGTTILPAPARRVVSLGYTTHDTLLALGVVPLALRFWYGPYDSGVWPWAAPLLGTARPEVLRGEISMERIWSHRPDLIVAIGSGITEAEYRVLDRIAPTLAHEAQHGPYGTPWQTLTRTLGRALGKEALAERSVTEVAARFGAASLRLGSRGRSAVAAYHWAGTAGVFLPGDARSSFLAALGFSLPPAVSAMAGGTFFRDLSPEDLSPLEADLLVWVSAFDTDPDLAALPMRRTLEAHRKGREVFAGPLVGSAMSHASILSMPFALGRLERDMAAALDGDPVSGVPTARKAGIAP